MLSKHIIFKHGTRRKVRRLLNLDVHLKILHGCGQRMLVANYCNITRMTARKFIIEWQSRIEIEYYYVAYFERITEFDAL